MVKVIILMRNIIKFVISQFKIFTIFHQVCEYFRFFLKNFSWILYIWFRPEFFIFYPNYHFQRNARLQRSNGEICNTLLTILELIDIFHDRFSNKKHGGKEHASFVKKEALFRRITQKKVSFKSSQVKI